MLNGDFLDVKISNPEDPDGRVITKEALVDKEYYGGLFRFAVGKIYGDPRCKRDEDKYSIIGPEWNYVIADFDNKQTAIEVAYRLGDMSDAGDNLDSAWDRTPNRLTKDECTFVADTIELLAKPDDKWARKTIEIYRDAAQKGGNFFPCL